MKSHIRALTNQLLTAHATRIAEPIPKTFSEAADLRERRGRVDDAIQDLASLAFLASVISDPDAEKLADMVAKARKTRLLPPQFPDDQLESLL